MLLRVVRITVQSRALQVVEAQEMFNVIIIIIIIFWSQCSKSRINNKEKPSLPPVKENSIYTTQYSGMNKRHTGEWKKPESTCCMIPFILSLEQTKPLVSGFLYRLSGGIEYEGVWKYSYHSVCTLMGIWITQVYVFVKTHTFYVYIYIYIIYDFSLCKFYVKRLNRGMNGYTN